MTASLPQTNATLTAVLGGGTSEDYTSPAGAASVKWEGEEDAYIHRKIRSAFNDNDELVRVQQTTLIIAGDLGIEINAGDTVKFKQWDPGHDEFKEFTGKAQTFETPMGLPSLPNFQKIALEDVLAT